MKINISKIEAAEIQLNEAIFLFFDNAHPVVIETLVGAVVGVLRPLGKQYGIKAPLHDSDLIKPEHKGEWIREYLHKPQNFLKHSDKDYSEVLPYEISVLPLHIYEACYLYQHLSSSQALSYRQSHAALLFEIWMWLKYPSLLKDPIEVNDFLCKTGLPENFNVNDFEFLKLVTAKFRIINNLGNSWQLSQRVK